MLSSAVLTLALLAQEPPAPPRHGEEITVTATRRETRVADTPASLVVLGREVIEASAAATTDDMLRQVPGFTLFRRGGSRFANPTTQGVTLRGIGASGASRALVLDDGIPLNDPFGGWVYWGRVAQPSLDRVEVLRGGGSDLYGSGAMGGVVQFIRRDEPSAMSAELSAGTQETWLGAAYASFGRGPWRTAISIDAFETAGHILVEPESRGAVDRAADSQHLAAEISIHRQDAFLRLSHYDEARNNGTPLQVNDTTIRQIAGGFEAALAGGRFTGRAWGGDQDYHQTFSAIAAGRNSERLTAEQDIPATSGGATVSWSRAAGKAHAIVAGGEFRHVEASEGQQTAAAFLEDVIMISPALSVTAGLRYDSWEGRDNWSPRLAALYRPARGPSLTASAYRAFRAPTLNELHRDFRVGNILTLANDALIAETVTGFEAGGRWRAIRATFYWMELDDLITNVTLSVTPSLITRQRQNVASGRTRGAEIEGEWRLMPALRLSAGYLYADAEFANGNRFPQVPPHQATAQLSWSSRFTAALQTRWSAMQYDDDLNQLELEGFFVADGFLSIPLGRGVAAIVAAENLFDERVEVSATPVITLGQPRSIRLGVRYAR
jgi:outer membrane receptor protein involved in Fe transport